MSTIKNLKSWLNYIQKEDLQPLTKNLSLNQMSFYKQAIEWARQTPVFRADDPFVLNRPSMFSLLKECHESVRTNMLIENIQQMRLYEKQEGGVQLTAWQLKIVNWWNDWIVNGWRHKKPQLYLYGRTNTGKTHFVNKLLQRCIQTVNNDAIPDPEAYLEQIFCPVANDKRFAYQEFNREIHTCTLIDEFDINQYDPSSFKKFIAGEPFLSDVKCSKAKRIVARMPMIFISNLEPPKAGQNSNYEGISSRLDVVCSDDVVMNEEEEI